MYQKMVTQPYSDHAQRFLTIIYFFLSLWLLVTWKGLSGVPSDQKVKAA
jgi:hypothetical protein